MNDTWIVEREERRRNFVLWREREWNEKWWNGTNEKRLREKERAKQKVLSDREKEVMWGPMFLILILGFGSTPAFTFSSIIKISLFSHAGGSFSKSSRLSSYIHCFKCTLHFKIHVNFRETALTKKPYKFCYFWCNYMCVFYNTLNHLLFYSIFSLSTMNM